MSSGIKMQNIPQVLTEQEMACISGGTGGSLSRPLLTPTSQIPYTTCSHNPWTGDDTCTVFLD